MFQCEHSVLSNDIGGCSVDYKTAFESLLFYLNGAIGVSFSVVKCCDRIQLAICCHSTVVMTFGQKVEREQKILREIYFFSVTAKRCWTVSSINLSTVINYNRTNSCARYSTLRYSLIIIISFAECHPDHDTHFKYLHGIYLIFPFAPIWRKINFFLWYFCKNFNFCLKKKLENKLSSLTLMWNKQTKKPQPEETNVQEQLINLPAEENSVFVCALWDQSQWRSVNSQWMIQLKRQNHKKKKKKFFSVDHSVGPVHNSQLLFRNSV